MALRRNGAASKDVPMELSREEYVSDMVQGRHDAASRDVPGKPKREEFVSHMALRQHVAATWDATNKHEKVEFVSHMELSWGQENCAASWDAPTILFGEEFV
jgi:hypothetical protein